MVTTLVAVAVIWRYLLHTRYGLVNYGLGRSAWRRSTGSATRTGRCRRSSLRGLEEFGYNMIILLAALQAIPRELYEAARSTAPALRSSPT